MESWLCPFKFSVSGYSTVFLALKNLISPQAFSLSFSRTVTEMIEDDIVPTLEA